MPFELLEEDVEKSLIDSRDLEGLIHAAYKEAERRRASHDHNTWGHMNNIMDYVRRASHVLQLMGKPSGRGI